MNIEQLRHELDKSAVAGIGEFYDYVDDYVSNNGRVTRDNPDPHGHCIFFLGEQMESAISERVEELKDSGALPGDLSESDIETAREEISEKWVNSVARLYGLVQEVQDTERRNAKEAASRADDVETVSE